jgi:diguanylate cyclase
MQIEIPKPSADARRVALWKAMQATGISVLLSELATLTISIVFQLHAETPAYIISGVLPLGLAGPGSYWQFIRHEQLKEAYRRLDLVASTDWLTQCLNRRAFTQAASSCFTAGREAALLVIDADSFKSINDRFGHESGDDALIAIARIIRQSVSEGDLVGRLGGEEFGVFVDGAAPCRAQQIAERIREGVMDIAYAPGAAPHPLSVSIGVAVSHGDLPFARLLSLADQQLYVAKQAGRNRVATMPAEAEPRSAAA